jgi:hypothetical protein
MKKTTKPSKTIQLDKQTVRSLSASELASANGGLLIDSVGGCGSCTSNWRTCR